jgi:hypothetical protein
VFRAVSVLCLLTACSLEVGFEDSRYTCAGGCPPGFACSPEGYCEPPGGPAAGGVDAPGQDDAAAPIDGADGVDAALVDAAVDAEPGAPTTTTLVATRDTQLYSPDPTFNFGDFAEIVCAASPTLDSPVLFGFDLSSIPAGASVVSASLRLTVANNDLTAGQVDVFLLREDWLEGNQAGAPGAASYNDRLVGVPWSTAGAKPPSRTDAAVATFTPIDTMTTYDVDLPGFVVQTWIALPAANFGVILTCPSGQDVAFHARGSQASREPKLVVTWTTD